MKRTCASPVCEEYLKQKRQRYCSVSCARHWGRYQGATGAVGAFLPGLQLVQRPGCFSFKWVCHCGAEWSRAPLSIPPCKHVDMQRIAVNTRKIAKAGHKKDPYPLARKYIDEASGKGTFSLMECTLEGTIGG